jgi:hypothetical protein
MPSPRWQRLHSGLRNSPQKTSLRVVNTLLVNLSHQAQNLVPERECRFESDRRHPCRKAPLGARRAAGAGAVGRGVAQVAGGLVNNLSQNF